MALNGWHRLGIVLAAAWALGVISFATLEYHGSQGQLRDGIFTCGEPVSPPQAPAKRHWDRDCGLFPRGWVAQGLFDDLPPYRRSLNLSRFLLVLLGPEVFVALCIVAVCWIASGFRQARSKGECPQPNMPTQARPSAQPNHFSHSNAEVWLHRLPRRWSRNSAVGGGALAALSTIPFFSKGDGLFAAFMLVGVALTTLIIAVIGYLCGLWARYSLAAPFALSPGSAIARIPPNWLTGAILLGAFLFATDILFGWRNTSIPSGNRFQDWGYLTGFFGTWMLGGYLTALVSRRGLRKAIDADRKPPSARPRPPASRGEPLQVEFSIG